jgi:RNA polymerase sigma-70 factor, ECF subfamily
MRKPAATPEVADPEVELPSRCASGDRDAQRALFEAQRLRVHRTLFRIMGSNRQMEDLAQDTFIELLGSIGSFAGRSSLATWVDTVAARVAYRELSRRASRGRQVEALEDLPSPYQDHEQHEDAREAMRRLYAALDRIPPKYRIAYTLHVVDGRSVREVAKITRASNIAVKNRIWRARRMMHERARRDPLLAEFLPRKTEPV